MLVISTYQCYTINLGHAEVSGPLRPRRLPDSRAGRSGSPPARRAVRLDTWNPLKDFGALGFGLRVPGFYEAWWHGVP